MRLRSILPAVAIVAAAAPAVAAPIVAGPFDGATLHTRYLYPSEQAVYRDYGAFRITGRREVASDLGGVAGVALWATPTGLLADFSSKGPGSSTWIASDFNGFAVSDDIGSAPAFTSVTIDPATTMTGFDRSRISFDADHIFVNWQGLSFDATTRVALTVNGPASALPEPATWATMVAGLGLAGARLRRRLGSRPRTA